MAHIGAIGDDRRGPVAESFFPRESGASLFILVQIQAGPPAFAGYAASARQAASDQPLAPP